MNFNLIKCLFLSYSSVLFSKLRKSIEKLQRLSKCPQNVTYIDPAHVIQQRHLDERRKLYSANAYLQYKQGKNDSSLITCTLDYSAVLQDVLQDQEDQTLEQPANTPRDTSKICRPHVLLRSRDRFTKIRAKSAPTPVVRQPSSYDRPVRSSSVMIHKSVHHSSTPGAMTSSRLLHANTADQSKHMLRKRPTLQGHIVKIPTALFDSESTATTFDLSSNASISDGNTAFKM